jgi:L-threonylcarbamoyladenylate synthase
MPSMVETRILPGDDPEAIREAAVAIQDGELVAFPTETVYGLGANALDAAAVARVFAIKDRPSFDPLIVHLAAAGEIRGFADEVEADDPRVARLAVTFWPGPLTIVLRKRPLIPGIVTAGLDTVGLRVPDHSVARALIEAAGMPIAAPSANRFGRVSPTRAEHVVAQLGGRVAIVLDGGPCRVGVESTVIRLAGGRAELLRPGGLAAEAIEAVIGPLAPVGDGPMTSSLSPGRSTSHYAPSVPLIVVGPLGGADAGANERIGLLAADDRGLAAAVAGGGPYVLVEVLSPTGDRVEQAANLFDALHRLDVGSLARIVAQSVPTDGLGRAIMDRLLRAAAT